MVYSITDICFDEDMDDLKASGIKRIKTAAEAFSFGEIGYLGSDSKMHKTNAGAEATTKGLCLMAIENISQDAEGLWLALGKVRNDSWDLTPGAPAYLSTTPGEFTQTIPSGSGDQVRIIGHADDDADNLFFNPDSSYVEVSS